jgi:hypothetical protein
MGVITHFPGIFMALWRQTYLLVLVSYVVFYDLDNLLLQSTIWFGFFRVFPLLSFGGYLLRRLKYGGDLTISALPIVIQIIVVNFIYFTYDMHVLFVLSSWLGIYASQYNYSVGHYQGCKNIKIKDFLKVFFIHVFSWVALVAITIVDPVFTMLAGNLILISIIATNIYSGLKISFSHRVVADLVLILYALSQAVWMLFDRFIVELDSVVPSDVKFLYAIISIVSTVIVIGINAVIVSRKDWIIEVSDNNRFIPFFAFFALVNFIFAVLLVYIFNLFYLTPIFIALASIISLAANTRVLSNINSMFLLTVINIIAILIFYINWTIGIELGFLLLILLMIKSITPFLFIRMSYVN